MYNVMLVLVGWSTYIRYLPIYVCDFPETHTAKMQHSPTACDTNDASERAWKGKRMFAALIGSRLTGASYRRASGLDQVSSFTTNSSKKATLDRIAPSL